MKAIERKYLAHAVIMEKFDLFSASDEEFKKYRKDLQRRVRLMVEYDDDLVPQDIAGYMKQESEIDHKVYYGSDSEDSDFALQDLENRKLDQELSHIIEYTDLYLSPNAEKEMFTRYIRRYLDIFGESPFIEASDDEMTLLENEEEMKESERRDRNMRIVEQLGNEKG